MNQLHVGLLDDDYFGSTPDFEAFDFDSLPQTPPSNNHSARRSNASSIVDLTATSPEMPRRSAKRRSDGAEPQQTSKRLRTENATREGEIVEDEEEDENAKAEELDLLGVEDDKTYTEAMKKRQADLLKQQRQEELDRPIKLATTQCVICLDQPDALTVTHCGHMFCSECLHGALNIGTGKRTCPVCRTAIGTVKKEGKQPKNGFFHMEMKLQSKKKGKQPAVP